MPVVEITHYTVLSAHLEAFLQQRPAIDHALRAMPGLRSSTVGRLGDRRFVDVAVWSSRADAEAAQRTAMSDERFAPLFTWLEDVSMELAEVVDA